MTVITLPRADGGREVYELSQAKSFAVEPNATLPRIAYAATHVVADPLADVDPWLTPAIDWDRTIAYRRYLWDLGLGVAEAMDTAQRGMGLDWPAASALIERSLAAAAPAERARIVCSVGTDHLDPAEARSLDDVVTAYLEQLTAVQKAGGRVVLMASRALARIATGPAEGCVVLVVVQRLLEALGLHDVRVLGRANGEGAHPGVDALLIDMHP